MIAQLYREGSDADPEAQLGLRFSLGGNFDHLDIAAGTSLRGDGDDFLTAGLALTF